MCLDWVWNFKFIINVGIAEAINFLTSELIEYFSLSGGGALEKSRAVPFLGDEILVYVCSEELGVFIFHQLLVGLIISIHQLHYTINTLG